MSSGFWSIFTITAAASLNWFCVGLGGRELEVDGWTVGYGGFDTNVSQDLQLQ